MTRKFSLANIQGPKFIKQGKTVPMGEQPLKLMKKRVSFQGGPSLFISCSALVHQGIKLTQLHQHFLQDPNNP